MGRTKISIVPQLTISIVEGEFAAENLIGEYVDRHNMVDMRVLAVIG